MEIRANIVEIGPVQQITDSFKKREFVVEYAENPKYPEYIKFETVQDKVSLLDGLAVGSVVSIAFNLRGRAYTDKMGKKAYFNSLQAWKIQAEGAGASPAGMPEMPAFTAADSPAENDLPF